MPGIPPDETPQAQSYEQEWQHLVGNLRTPGNPCLQDEVKKSSFCFKRDGTSYCPRHYQVFVVNSCMAENLSWVLRKVFMLDRSCCITNHEQLHVPTVEPTACTMDESEHTTSNAQGGITLTISDRDCSFSTFQSSLPLHHALLYWSIHRICLQYLCRQGMLVDHHNSGPSQRAHLHCSDSQTDSGYQCSDKHEHDAHASWQSLQRWKRIHNKLKQHGPARPGPQPLEAIYQDAAHSVLTSPC